LSASGGVFSLVPGGFHRTTWPAQRETMETSLMAWSCEAADAVLNTGALSCRLQLTAPERGLHQWAMGEHRLPIDQVFGVHITAGDQQKQTIERESFVRRGDLVATYWPGDVRKLRVEIYWRSIEPLWLLQGMYVFDLLVSVQTNLLDASPSLQTESCFQAQALWQLTPQAGGTFHQQELATGRQTASLPCVLASLTDDRFSYAEMIHPADAQDATCRAPAGPAVESQSLSQRLFGPELEKGVILRARLRALIIDHAAGITPENTADLVWSAYQDLLHSPLPLTV
jgi:hypothetical protein